MARIPTIQARTTSIPVVGLPRARALEVANLGGALQDAGQGMSALAGAIQKQDDEDAKVWALKAESDAKLWTQSELTRAKESAAPGADGFTPAFEKSYDKYVSDVEKSAPNPRAKQYFREFSAQYRTAAAGAAMDFEAEQRWKGRVTTAEQAADSSAGALFQNPGIYDREYSDYAARIDSLGLPPDVKQKLKDQARTKFSDAVIEGSLQRGDVAGARAARDRIYGRAMPVDAASLIRSKEGFRDTPYWDVNAHRAGYGSDTVTRADGTVEKVTPQTRVSREEAELDLQRRIGEFQQGIVNDVGADNWSGLPEGTKAALTSVAYNYGSLPQSVVAAVKTGNRGRIAQAVEDLSSHNAGINAKRRQDEASIIRADGSAPIAPDIAKASAWERQFDQSAVESARLRKAENEAAENDLKNRLLNGSAGIPEIEAARQTWLTDADKVVQLYDFAEKARTDVLAAQRVMSGERLNPFSSDDRKVANNAYAGMMQGGRADPLTAMETVYRQTGILPSDAVQGLRASILGNDEAASLRGMQVASALMSNNPNVFAGSDGGADIAKNATAFEHYVERGMTAEDAARKVHAINSPEYQSKMKTGEKELNDFTKGISVSDVESAFGLDRLGWWNDTEVGFTYEQQTAIVSDFAEIAQERFRETGDADLAKEYARKEMSRVYGETSFNGKRVFTKYPPDKIYPAVRSVETGEPSHDYIARQAAADASALAGTEIKPEDVVLAHIPGVTSRAWTSGQPVPYQLSYFREENGQRFLEVAHQDFIADPRAAQAEFDAAEPARRAEWEERAARRRSVMDVGPIGSFGGIARAGEATRAR